MDNNLPAHIAVVMDGNGRWAKRRGLSRVAGHREGVESVRSIVRSSAEAGIKVLSLFAFSSENWRRPRTEVASLLDLFLKALSRELKKLHEQNIKLQFIGDLSRFSKRLQLQMQNAETLTQPNSGMRLIIAVNYGGRWDLTRAAREVAQQVKEGKLRLDEINEATLQNALSLTQVQVPEPDLFIRTSGEQRLSNFFLWQLAYTELYFTDVLWPDFREQAFADALAFYANRQRRFGYTPEQVEENYA